MFFSVTCTECFGRSHPSHEITGETNPLGLAEVELGKQTYKTYVGYFDPNTSEMNGKVQVTAFCRAEYTAAITALTGSADLKTAFGNGGTAETSEIGTEATWNVRISAKLGADTFQISLNRDSMTVSGYVDDATLAAVYAWMQISRRLRQLIMLFLAFLIMLFGKLVEGFLVGQR